MRRRTPGDSLARIDKALKAVAEHRSELLYGGLLHGDTPTATLIGDWQSLCRKADELLDARLELTRHAT